MICAQVTIVHYAAAKGRLDLLELVLGHRNAPPNAADLDGHYGPTMSERGGRCWPMHLAAMADRPAAISRNWVLADAFISQCN